MRTTPEERAERISLLGPATVDEARADIAAEIRDAEEEATAELQAERDAALADVRRLEADLAQSRRLLAAHGGHGG